MSYGRPPPRIDGMVSLKVDNLTYRTTPEDLRRVFERCGEVGDIYIPRDRFTRESRGFAFVRFYDKRDAEDALDAMDGRIVDGRELRVQMAPAADPGQTAKVLEENLDLAASLLAVAQTAGPDHVPDLNKEDRVG
ncbi:SR family splicing factor SC35 [Carabus blaptoides fortunei]